MHEGSSLPAGGSTAPGRHAASAREFVDSSSFVWHQRFELVPGIYTPGGNDIEYLMNAVGVPADLTGRRVLDVGTANAGAAFIAERRGAERVVAVDIFPSDWFGVDSLIDFLDSKVAFVRGSVYDLPRIVADDFDLVFLFGVLYHLRHPLLALDALRAVATGEVFVETAVADHELGSAAGEPLVRFYPGDELAGDSSNWFAPTVRALREWSVTSGYEVLSSNAWPEEAPQRASVHLAVTRGDPLFEQVSYERSRYEAGV